MQGRLHGTVGRAVALAFALALAGCASLERFQRDMDSYIGWDIERLRAHFGYGYIERDLGDGLRAFTWTWADQDLRPGYVTPEVIHSYRSAQGATHVVVSPGMYFPPDYYYYSCEFSFIIDAGGRAIGWRAHGNGCGAYTGPGTVMQHGTVP
jgi:hypothetical protein